MKKLVFGLLLAAGLINPAAAQQTASGQFDVNITLIPVCSVSAIAPVAFSYTSGGGAVAATGGDFTVTCTNGAPYTFGLQAGNGAATPPGAATIGPITDDAVNLAYSLGLSAAGGSGNGAAQSYNITGSMAALQAGTCAGGVCTNAAATNNTHTLIVNY